MIAANTGLRYERLETGIVLPGVHRWIGRCKKCGATHQVEGTLKSAIAPEQPYPSGARAGMTRGRRHDYVVDATDGRIFTMNADGGDVSLLPVRCGDHWCRLQRVHEGTKASKHECGARCRNATGPSCDCKCRGKNHGANC
jgi:hypothetical protein